MNYQNGGYNPYGFTPNYNTQNFGGFNNQPFQISQIRGRIIKNPNEIMANEVPMDGSVSMFPMEDYSCIYAKTWGPDGIIRAVKYVPEVQEPVKALPVEDDLKSYLTDRMDKLEAMINSLMKPSTKKGGVVNDDSH